MKYYGYGEFVQDAKHLVLCAKEQKVDGFIGILRGGATLAHFMCEGMGSKSMYAMQSSSYQGQSKEGKPVVSRVPKLANENIVAIVDEIVDSGETMQCVLREFESAYPDKKFVTMTIFQKPNAIMKADIYLHETDEWIDFFWEADMRGDTNA